jgi:hypothetical protein
LPLASCPLPTTLCPLPLAFFSVPPACLPSIELLPLVSLSSPLPGILVAWVSSGTSLVVSRLVQVSSPSSPITSPAYPALSKYCPSLALSSCRPAHTLSTRQNQNNFTLLVPFRSQRNSLCPPSKATCVRLATSCPKYLSCPSNRATNLRTHITQTS